MFEANGRKNNKEVSKANKLCNKKKISKMRTGDSNWQCFVEKDYIILSFDKNGARHVGRDEKLKMSNPIRMPRSRPINRKVSVGFKFINFIIISQFHVELQGDEKTKNFILMFLGYGNSLFILGIRRWTIKTLSLRCYVAVKMKMKM